MGDFDTFKLWYAKGVSPNNTFLTADANLKIKNSETPAGEEIQLIYCMPAIFAKRTTDVSNAIAVDPSSPDSGTGASDVIIRFLQNRKVTRTVQVLGNVLDMFYVKGNDEIFQSGRFGLENSDCPELDALPLPTAGYKLLSFRQEPNQDSSSVIIWEIRLKFLGDHTKLGTKS